MRPALQRLLGSPSALSVLRNAIESPIHCQSCWSCRKPFERQSKRVHGLNASTLSPVESIIMEEDTLARKLKAIRRELHSGKFGHKRKTLKASTVIWRESFQKTRSYQLPPTTVGQKNGYQACSRMESIQHEVSNHTLETISQKSKDTTIPFSAARSKLKGSGQLMGQLSSATFPTDEPQSRQSRLLGKDNKANSEESTLSKIMKTQNDAFLEQMISLDRQYRVKKQQIHSASNDVRKSENAAINMNNNHKDTVELLRRNNSLQESQITLPLEEDPLTRAGDRGLLTLVNSQPRFQQTHRKRSGILLRYYPTSERDHALMPNESTDVESTMSANPMAQFQAIKHWSLPPNDSDELRQKRQNRTNDQKLKDQRFEPQDFGTPSNLTAMCDPTESSSAGSQQEVSDRLCQSLIKSEASPSCPISYSKLQPEQHGVPSNKAYRRIPSNSHIRRHYVDATEVGGGEQDRNQEGALQHLNPVIPIDRLNERDHAEMVALEAALPVQCAEKEINAMTRVDCTPVDSMLTLQSRRRGTHWTDLLKTKQQYDYESNLDAPAIHGPRLVDHDYHASDFELWLQLVLYQRRHNGTHGLKALWGRIRALDLRMPTHGPTADQLWSHFVEVGLNHDMLQSVTQYAIGVQQQSKSYWKDLYFKIISSKVLTNSPKTYHYHSELYKLFPPTVAQFLSLFDLVHKQSGRSLRQMLQLQRIYSELPFGNLYADIMTRLYQNDDLTAATSWHGILLSKRDLPSDIRLSRPLFRYMVLHGDRKLLIAMVDRMIEARIQLPAFRKHALPISPSSQELIDQRLADVHGIQPTKIDDDFCARLFATTWFSIRTVVKLLRMFGVDTIGAHSLRETLVRGDASPKFVRESLSQIETAGIKVVPSTYSSLLTRLALDDNARLLESIAQCDLHPDTFDDRTLQESLLYNYDSCGDQVQIDRTLAILTAKCTDATQPVVYWNVQLRLQLKQKDIKAINRTLEFMHASGILVDTTSSSYVRICLLTRRDMGKRPRYIYDLPVIMNIWQNVLKSGGIVPAIAWREILRRLGMTGQLVKYEKLALWLAKYYSGSSAGPSLGLLPGCTQVMSKAYTRRLIMVPSQLDPAQRSHPLYLLFPPPQQQAVVAWGFQHARVGGTDWRWGLQLLLKLKLFKVFVERSTVAKACILRLAILFGSGYSNRKTNRRTKAQNAYGLRHYVQEMEKIGGAALLFGRNGPIDYEEKIKLLEEDISHRTSKSNIRRVIRSSDPGWRHLAVNTPIPSLDPPRSEASADERTSMTASMSSSRFYHDQ